MADQRFRRDQLLHNSAFLKAANNRGRVRIAEINPLSIASGIAHDGHRLVFQCGVRRLDRVRNAAWVWHATRTPEQGRLGVEMGWLVLA